MEVPDCQVTLKSDANVVQIRELNVNILQFQRKDKNLELMFYKQSDFIGKLVRIPGIVIGASTLSSRATQISAMCKSCRNIKTIPITGGFSSIVLPRNCDSQALSGGANDCPLDPFVIVHDKCKFVDSQVIKLQEAPDMVPVGDLPRHTILNADRWLTNRVVPGMRAVVMGIYSIFQNKAAVSIIFLDPLKSKQVIAFLISWLPKIEGARLAEKVSYKSC